MTPPFSISSSDPRPCYSPVMKCNGVVIGPHYTRSGNVRRISLSQWALLVTLNEKPNKVPFLFGLSPKNISAPDPFTHFSFPFQDPAPCPRTELCYCFLCYCSRRSDTEQIRGRAYPGWGSTVNEMVTWPWPFWMQSVAPPPFLSRSYSPLHFCTFSAIKHFSFQALMKLFKGKNALPSMLKESWISPTPRKLPSWKVFSQEPQRCSSNQIQFGKCAQINLHVAAAVIMTVS